MRNRQPQLGRSLIVIIGFRFCRLEEEAEEEEEEEKVVVEVEQQESRWKAAGQLCTWAVVFLDVHFNDNQLRANHTMPLMPM